MIEWLLDQLLLIFIFFFLPLVYYRGSPEELVSFFYISIPLFILLSKLVNTGFRIKPGILDKVIIIFYSWLLLSSLLSTNLYISFFGNNPYFQGFFQMLGGPLVYFIIRTGNFKSKQIRGFLRSLFFSGLSVSIIFILSFLVQKSGFLGDSFNIPLRHTISAYPRGYLL